MERPSSQAHFLPASPFWKQPNCLQKNSSSLILTSGEPLRRGPRRRAPPPLSFRPPRPLALTFARGGGGGGSALIRRSPPPGSSPGNAGRILSFYRAFKRTKAKVTSCIKVAHASYPLEKCFFPRFCQGSKVSVGEWKLCHTILLLESLITRLPVSRRETVVCLPEDVLLSHTVEPLVSKRTRLPSWFSDILEP